MIDERSPDLGEWDAGPRELDTDGQWDYWARAEGGAGPGCLDGTVQCSAQCAVECGPILTWRCIDIHNTPQHLGFERHLYYSSKLNFLPPVIG